MRRTFAALLIAAAFAAGCGGDDDETAATTATDTATTETATTEAETTATGGGGAVSAEGEQVFTENCAGCHTLEAANATGQNAPNLDEAQPSAARVIAKVNAGGGGMPSFRGQLSEAQIAAVAAFVSQNAGS